MDIINVKGKVAILCDERLIEEEFYKYEFEIDFTSDDVEAANIYFKNIVSFYVGSYVLSKGGRASKCNKKELKEFINSQLEKSREENMVKGPIIKEVVNFNTSKIKEEKKEVNI